jgi:hypothetical protein
MLNGVVRKLGDTPYTFATRIRGRSDSLEVASLTSVSKPSKIAYTSSPAIHGRGLSQ